MSHPKPRLLAALGAATLLAGFARAADLKHDLYFCVNVSGQGSVMGSRVAAASGLYRSGDREKLEHVGFNNFRTFGLTSDPRNSAILLETVIDGAQRSTDRGKTWRRTTGWDMTEPKGVAFDPNAPDDVYMGLPDGIAVSHDGGQTWRRSHDGIKRAYTHPIVVDRTKKGRVIAGTELGIYISDDGAKSWQRVLPTAKVTYELAQSPHDPKVFIAATSADGAFISRDGARTWQRFAGLPTKHTLHYARFDPHDAKRLVVCGWEAGVQISEDGGTTWTDCTAGLPNRQIWSIAIDPDLPGRLYAAPYLAPVHVSDDNGRTWRPKYFEKAIVYDIRFLPHP
ncbi:MAG: hypothetical protein HZA93_16965 [Verrucomicrobia bacterium]|nr:hypothetical protein [Verrucomicrobiota bacterium]